MNRIERQLFRLNDELGRLRREAELTEAELNMHRHLDDDAVRDALVSDHPGDRAEARQTSKDVARLEAALTDVRGRLARAERKREVLLRRLGSP
jgi:hypothetical protein